MTVMKAIPQVFYKYDSPTMLPLNGTTMLPENKSPSLTTAQSSLAINVSFYSTF